MKHFIILFFLLVVCLSAFILFESKNEIGIYDPKLKEKNFRFSNYKTREELEKAFRILFPPGTPKSYVDQVLIEAGKAESWQAKEIPRLIYYRELNEIHFKQPPNNAFIFDEKNKVINAWVRNGDEIFPEQQTFEDFQKKATQLFLNNKQKE